MNKRFILPAVMLMLFMLSCGLIFPASTPTPDLLATLRSSTPLAQTQAADGVPPEAITQPPYIVTATQAAAAPASPTALIPSTSGGPPGKIVFTCQVFKVQAANQICIMNADGTGWRRLTTDNNRQHYYGSLSPDGKSVVYAAFREENVYEIYEMNLENGRVEQLTNRLGVLNAPEISPDGKRIIFMHWIANKDRYEVWVMRRDGNSPHRLFDMTAWDPTWSPDGSRILFASSRGGTNQLWTINVDGTGLKKITDLQDIRGRSDWSSQDQVVTYAGESWQRELYLMDADGSDVHKISKPNGNSQGAAFSPDGQWVVFTAYFDHFNDIHGCEIYIMRIDGTDLRRLTDNDYCDYQPRWGP